MAVLLVVTVFVDDGVCAVGSGVYCFGSGW
jgi:hypothetical protein